MVMSSITVAGVTPDLKILGGYQNFIFANTNPSVAFQLTNTFVPLSPNISATRFDMRNNTLSGYSWEHTTGLTDTFGGLSLRRFVNAGPLGVPILVFNSLSEIIIGASNGTQIFLSGIVSAAEGINMVTSKITNLGTPTAATDAVTKAYVDGLPDQPITLTGAVTGTGTGTIATTYNGTVAVANGGTGITSTSAYAIICGGTTSTGALQSVASLGNAGQVLTSSGPGALPTWTSDGGGTVTSITAGTGLTGGTITSSGIIGLSSPVSLTNGGTNSSLTASNGGIFYSTSTAGAVLSGTATANQLLLSGASGAPSWSTVTHPATTTINQILYSSAANTISGLATANNGVLTTSGAGVPSISSTLPTAVQGNITSVGTIASGTWNGTTVAVANGGTGISTTTPYAIICGGTTSTGALQQISGLGTTGQVLTSSGANALPTWTTRAYCNIIMGALVVNATITSVVTATVYVKVAGTTTLALSNAFTMPTNNRITYTGASPINLLVNITLSFLDNGAAGVYDTFALFKNNAIASSFVAPISMNPDASRASLSISTIISMVNNDFLEVFVTSSSNTTNITVETMNFVAHAL